ncbi:hypothetical protein GZH46_00084, partial [Fragariocoptes setiger]
MLMNASWFILTADSIERSGHMLLALVVGTHLLATALCQHYYDYLWCHSKVAIERLSKTD